MATYRNRGHFDADGAGKIVGCRKYSQRHPTLLPGIFTVYCPHGTYILADNPCTQVMYNIL